MELNVYNLVLKLITIIIANYKLLLVLELSLPMHACGIESRKYISVI